MALENRLTVRFMREHAKKRKKLLAVGETIADADQLARDLFRAGFCPSLRLTAWDEDQGKWVAVILYEPVSVSVPA